MKLKDLAAPSTPSDRPPRKRIRKRIPTGRKPGRPKNAKNKKTIEREAVESMIRERLEARDTGRKLAKEVLEDFMLQFVKAASAVNPFSESGALKSESKKRRHDLAQYMMLAKEACQCAKDLAQFQSPKYSAVAVAPVPTVESRRMVLTVNIFDDRGENVARTIDGEPVAIEDRSQP